ncbi:MAG TPA: dipeptide epimerase [Chthoniobacteraceae bacterium]|jgi:L-alanine-DL-glutamate epimerase-like enolase superfamily enzyme|nr:dipeptide epimerase [Chthoniobacteraceae bacterium]
MKPAIAIHRMHPRHVFRIARGDRSFADVVFLRVEADGVRGYGEASPIAFYHETEQGVAKRLAGLRDFLDRLVIETVADIAAAWTAAWPLLDFSRAAQCALDLALWDWLARKKGCSVAELAHGHTARPVRSFCTIGLSTSEEFFAKVEELSEFAAIKIKSNSEPHLYDVEAVRQRSKAVIAIDANCAWGALDLSALAHDLCGLDVAFIEQPYPPGDDGILRPREHALPIFADESCVTESDVERIPQRYDGFNVKLVKCGGLTPALRMLARGRAAGCGTMVGCMLESSLLISAGLVAAQTTDYADLDGAWLLRDDPCPGMHFDRGLLQAAPGPGFGVQPPDALFG